MFYAAAALLCLAIAVTTGNDLCGLLFIVFAVLSAPYLARALARRNLRKYGPNSVQFINAARIALCLTR